MKQSRPWTLTRHWVELPGAQRRWDRAYQLVLRMAAERPDKVGTGTAPMGVLKESHHANPSRLCPGLDPAPSPGTHD